MKNKSHLTAITRKKPSRPMRILEEKGLLKGEMLDYGCGRGFDAEYYGMDKYDPYYAPEFPKKKYDVVTCHFVLNVMLEDDRQSVINSVMTLLKGGGTAYFTVRRDVKTEGKTSRGTMQWNVVLDLDVVEENRDFCIYKKERTALMGLQTCKYVYNIFGSKDSQDADVMVFLDDLPDTIEACKQMCKRCEKEIDLGRETNVNLAVVENGIVTQCFKGTPDEVNNSILATYDLHDMHQEFPCQIERPVKRDVYLKSARALRIILTLLSRTHYRQMVKGALKNSASYKIEVLRQINFCTIESFNKNGLEDEDCWKNIVFQILQTYYLLTGKEIYTKGEARSMCPSLSSVINREPITSTDKCNINRIKDELLEWIQDYSVNTLIKE